MIVITVEGTVDAPADTAYRYIADTREHHPRFLPSALPAFAVESGGVGAGTITRFKVTVGRCTREYRNVVAEPESGRVLTESDTASSAVTTFTVSPVGRRLVRADLHYLGRRRRGRRLIRADVRAKGIVCHLCDVSLSLEYQDGKGLSSIAQEEAAHRMKLKEF